MSAVIDVPESSNLIGKGTIPSAPAPPIRPAGWKKGIAIIDFILRLGAIASALGAAATMATSDETLPFFTQFFQFEASYDSFSTFQYVTLSNSTHFIFINFQNMHIIINIKRSMQRNAGFLSLLWHLLGATWSYLCRSL